VLRFYSILDPEVQADSTFGSLMLQSGFRLPAAIDNVKITAELRLRLLLHMGVKLGLSHWG
jgi:hypothetical protein